MILFCPICQIVRFKLETCHNIWGVRGRASYFAYIHNPFMKPFQLIHVQSYRQNMTQGLTMWYFCQTCILSSNHLTYCFILFNFDTCITHVVYRLNIIFMTLLIAILGQDSDLQKLQLPGTNIHAYEKYVLLSLIKIFHFFLLPISSVINHS